MQFSLILIVFGTLFICFIWFVNIIISFLHQSTKLKSLKDQLYQHTLAYIDSIYVGLYNANPKQHTQFLSFKSKLWQSKSVNLTFWNDFNNLRPYVQIAEEQSNNILQKRLIQKKYMFFHSLHTYNEEVLNLEKRLKKTIFRLLNRFIFKIDSTKNPILPVND